MNTFIQEIEEEVLAGDEDLVNNEGVLVVSFGRSRTRLLFV